ncbi:alpha-E domain-containing protein [Niveibacterium umoris]|uniref:Putative alpha-E superfamily protein n=1 Tax=Niveibacterium umoris TaxID=1193620 RepID=A0A840BQ00_9RHOO|nr:alpha-E domain-containing protein [Niveibacterium umoris]MBB4013549.1 putative alpha-E superfamily protein [Niveibacterium umoris]
MLSRTADNLYWMARYMERAENLARILDVHHRMSLLPQSTGEIERQWTATLDIMGMLGSFRERQLAINTDAVMHFMMFDRDNPSSIVSCLRAARENAHTVRGTLTSELWEAINATWLKLNDFAPSRLLETGPTEFFEWVKHRSHLSRGVTVGTMLRDEAFHFTRLGTYIERADNTLRILDVKYHLLLGAHAPNDSAVDYYQWSALLHSVSAFEIYRRVYRDQITPTRVAELLLLRPDMPRSLAYCMREVYGLLQAVANGRSSETQRRAGELEASLRFGRIEELIADGLHEYLDTALHRILDLGQRISDDFLVPVTT